MKKENPKQTDPPYEVAISFLSQDADTANALRDELSKGLEVFLYSKQQEQLAGTDGSESLRKAFFSDSRINVILYREGWGQTPMTRVEEAAIKDKGLEDGFQSVFLIKLDKSTSVPKWIPRTSIWLDLEVYGLSQAVGAIKLRVQESGGQFSPMTAVNAARLQAERSRLLDEKKRLMYGEGLTRVHGELRNLFSKIEALCSEITQAGEIQIEAGSKFNERDIGGMFCTLRANGFCVQVCWQQRYTDSVDPNPLFIIEYKGRMILPDEAWNFTHFDQPAELKRTRYSPDLSPSREIGWIGERDKKFLASADLADDCVQLLLALLDRNR